MDEEQWLETFADKIRVKLTKYGYEEQEGDDAEADVLQSLVALASVKNEVIDELRTSNAALTLALGESKGALKAVAYAASECERKLRPIAKSNLKNEHGWPVWSDVHNALAPIVNALADFQRDMDMNDTALAAATPPQQEKKPCLDPELHEIRPCDCHDQEKI